MERTWKQTVIDVIRIAIAGEAKDRLWGKVNIDGRGRRPPSMAGADAWLRLVSPGHPARQARRSTERKSKYCTLN